MRWRDIFLGFGECIHTKGVVRQSGWVDTVFFRKDATHEVLTLRSVDKHRLVVT